MAVKPHPTARKVEGVHNWHGSADHAEKLMGIGLGGGLSHVCIGGSLNALEAAKDLRRAGKVGIEDSPNGPIVTRTWRGPETIKAFDEEDKGFAVVRRTGRPNGRPAFQMARSSKLLPASRYS